MNHNFYLMNQSNHLKLNNLFLLLHQLKLN